MPNRHAVVIGGSLAGLCAARVLSRFFDRVTVLERDAVPYGPCRRPGVPHSRHAHVLLARGRRELELLFPGFAERLCERGALELDTGSDFATLRSHGWTSGENSGIETLLASRELIEATARERLQQTRNVAFRDRACVEKLLVRRNGSPRVSGVLIRGGERDGRRLGADLVVDASGRESRAPKWLAAAGIPTPEETRVDSSATISTRWFTAPQLERRPAHWWWQGIRIEARDGEILAVLLPMENQRWVVSIVGFGASHPPRDEASFLPFLERLPSPLLAQALRRAEPLSPVYNSRSTANRFRHYEGWKAPLPGFLAVGDAVCALNPAYGQGMSCAALSASALEKALARTSARAGPELPRRLFQMQARMLGDAWNLAVSADLRFTETEGRRSTLSAISGRYLALLGEVALRDRASCRGIDEVYELLRPASTLFAPSLLARTLGHVLARHLRRRANPPRLPASPPRGC